MAQQEIQGRLRDITPVENAELNAFWESEAQKLLAPEPPEKIKEIAEQFLIVVTCRDEKHQVELLGRFVVEGLKCKVLVA